MLKKENRLKSKKAFSATYHNHKIISDDLIVLYIGRLKTPTDNIISNDSAANSILTENINTNSDNRPTRVGFVVSKKVHKRAVKRNRIKRLMRENIRLIFKNRDANFIDVLEKYQSFIFMAKTGIVDRNFEEVKASILTLLNKLANKNI